MVSSSNIENNTETLSTYKQAVDSNDSRKIENFKGKPLNLYLQFVTELSPYMKTGKDIRPYLKDMVRILINAKRYFDLAVIYNFLKSQNKHRTETGEVYPLMKEVVSPYANDLFIRSLTYSSAELNEMFSDVFGNDPALLMELISHIFKEYGLFNAKLSENIYRKFIDTAESDIKSFIEHSDTRFLAFYFSNLPRLPFVSHKHIANWTNLILSHSTKEIYTAKILAALKEHPSLDFLLIFLLSPRENDRLEALSLLKSCLDMGLIEEGVFKAEAVYFLERVITSQFYDFHNISRTQKETIAALLLIAGGEELTGQILAVLKERNSHGDPKIQDTKIIFVYLLGKLVDKNPGLLNSLKLMLQDSSIEENVKEAILKSISASGPKKA